MRRLLAGALVVAAMSGCGGMGPLVDTAGKPASRGRQAGADVNALIDAVAAGGAGRDRAADRLAKLMSTAGTPIAADPARVNKAFEQLQYELSQHPGHGPPTCGSWAATAEYKDLRFATELIIDAAGRVGATGAIDESLSLRDPYLLAWGIVSATSLGTAVDPDTVARASADDYARSILLREPDVELPAEEQTGVQAARADMAQWLAYETELGCEPKEMRLMGRFDRDRGEYFVFRFRSGDPASRNRNTWLAGVSGPFGGDKGGNSDTFSDFKPAASATAAEHLRRIVAVTP